MKMPTDLKLAAIDAAQECGLTLTDYVAGLIARATGRPDLAPAEQETLLPAAIARSTSTTVQVRRTSLNIPPATHDDIETAKGLPLAI